MKKNTLFIALLFVFTLVKSQDYKFGIGARAGLSNGLTAKYLFYRDDSKQMGVELLAGKKNDGNLLTGLWEIQKELHLSGSRNSGVFYYFGLGGHLGQYKLDAKFVNRDNVPYNKDIMNIGVDVTFGIEYVFAEFPIAIGIDARPYYDIVNPGKYYYDAGVSVKYVIKNR